MPKFKRGDKVRLQSMYAMITEAQVNAHASALLATKTDSLTVPVHVDGKQHINPEMTVHNPDVIFKEDGDGNTPVLCEFLLRNGVHRVCFSEQVLEYIGPGYLHPED